MRDSVIYLKESGRPKCLLKIRGNMRFVPEITPWLLHKLRGTQVYSVSQQSLLKLQRNCIFKNSLNIQTRGS